ncbi:hypothetical protein GGF44_002081 [Coemansia sp. RSA 1694]|nr:hypothetical protein GGF38_000784 [Coemansia sp. RSA 25]KAJ2641522.1 hypothetical protein GGF44_002081 [Coemansia sp. RSA 1694]
MALDRLQNATKRVDAAERDLDRAEQYLASAENELSKQEAEQKVEKAKKRIADKEKALDRARDGYAKAQADKENACVALTDAQIASDREEAAYGTAMVAYDSKTRILRDKDGIDSFFGLTVETQDLVKPIQQAKVLLSPAPDALPSIKLPKDGAVKPIVTYNHYMHRSIRESWDVDFIRSPSRPLANYVKFGETAHLSNGVGPWYLPNEQVITGYFLAEFEPAIREVLRVTRPEAEFVVIQGNTHGHADLFLQVRVKDKTGQWIYSSMAVEFKLPYGENKRPIDGSTSSPEWAKIAEMPSSRLAWQFAMQLDKYMSEGSCGAPDAVKGTVNPRFGIGSTYNETWIFEAKPKDGKPLRAKAKPPAPVPVAGSSTNPDPEALAQAQPRDPSEMAISDRFSAANQDPCIAAVFAYPLIIIVDDMKDSTSGYAHVPLEAHIAGPTGEASAIKRAKRKREANKAADIGYRDEDSTDDENVNSD